MRFVDRERELDRLRSFGGTILEAEPAEPLPATRLDAFRKLQEAVQLTPDKAEAWKAAVRDARR